MALSADEARHLLTVRQEELLKAQSETRDDRKPVELDQASVGRLSRMDAMQMQAMAEAQSRKRAQELQRITTALRRLEDGTYGECLKCGEDIAENRLRLDPSTAYCIDCARG